MILLAGELHQHIEISVKEQRAQASFCNFEKGCTLVKPETLGLPAGQMPVDLLTGTLIYVSEFMIFPDRTAIDSPGFESIAGQMAAGDRVRYRASGHLSYWSLDRQQWTLAPEGIQIRLAGGLDLQPSQDCGQVFCIPPSCRGNYVIQPAWCQRCGVSDCRGSASRRFSAHASRLDYRNESGRS